MRCAQLAFFTALIAAPASAFAGSLDEVATGPAVTAPMSVAPAPARNRLQFVLGAGVSTAPGYFGSDERAFGPTGTIRLEGLTLGGTTFADPDADPYGIGVGASLRYIAERSSADYPELAGLADVGASLELGASLSWTQRDYEVFADLRFGAVGHEGFVGELGADLYLHPTDRLTLSAGPRVLFGDDTFTGSYFGVTADEATVSSFDAYDARGGIVSGGIELGAEYAVTEDWGVEGTIRYDRYLGDAADSPIVLGGSDDAVSASIMATRRFTLEF